MAAPPWSDLVHIGERGTQQQAGWPQPPAGHDHLGAYPIVTSQHSPTTFHQLSEQIQQLFF